MTSEFTVPSWSLRHHRQEQVQGEDLNISSLVNHHNHHQHHGCGQSSSQLVPMSNYEVAELTWENGQLLMHELGGIFSSKPTWGRAGDTLESIVHQATCKYTNHDDNNNNDQNLGPQGGHTLENVGSIVGSSDGKWVENTSHAQSGISRRRFRHGFDHFGKDLSHDWQNEAGVSASAGAILPRKNDTTAVTLASFESSQRSKKSKTTDEDSTSHGAPENREKEERETRRSCSTRKGRAAAIHNQSERRRRDRINQKMKALQKLVPNASKTDKASMLDEVIEYLKQLQAQVQMMSSSARFMPHMMMMPTGMHHHQMSVLRMGMAAGMAMNMGMLDSTGIPATLTPPFQPVKAANSTSAHVPPPSLVAPTQGPQQKSTESCISYCQFARSIQYFSSTKYENGSLQTNGNAVQPANEADCKHCSRRL